MMNKPDTEKNSGFRWARALEWIGAIVAVTLLTSIVAALASSSKSSTPHNGGGDCAACHLNDANAAMAKGDALVFTADIDSLCNKCHELEPGMSHPSGVQALGRSPEEFPLDWAGRITCATCHYTHTKSKPNVTGYMIRGERLGRQFCQSCHEDIAQTVGRKHDNALSRSHLVVGSRGRQAQARSLLDPISLQCLGCHDGIIGKVQDVAVGKSKGSWQHISIGLSHPIGVSYPPSGRESRGYRPTATLDPRIRLFNGKLGCASCHDAYFESKHGLVMSNERSALCLSCHIK